MHEDEAVLEAAWIEQAKRGDLTALSALLQRHYTFVLRYLIKATLQPELAKDLAQDTMLRSMEKINLYNGRSRFSSWLITIATRLYIDHVRRQKRETRLFNQQYALRKLKWETEHAGGEWPDMLEALGSLPEEIRMPIILKHYYGYSYEEIAEMLDIPAGTVKSRVHNGLRSLRKELAEHDGEESKQPAEARDNR
ncbi:MAG: polymerase sigma factor SigY [Paenibacillaceae bacterium]|nr:polymerase sigma factor SigY [Paenibacillaceae bacterium]